MADILGLINQGVGYAREGIGLVRNLLTKAAEILPFDPNLAVAVVFLIVSLWAGHAITKKFVTRPLSGSYIFYTLLISISIYLNIMYL